MMNKRQVQGFTLVEMIVVIVITGIIGGIVAIFIQAPVQGYVDSARRAELTDIADTAFRRVGRDLRLALPNSVRVTGTCDGSSSCFIEFLPTQGGGRYRVAADATDDVCPGATASDDLLSFAAADTCFEVLGTMPPVAVSDQVVVYNLGVAGADAYAGNTLATHNRRAVSAVGASSITLTSANRLPFDSPGHRFHVVTTPVTYACAPVAGGVGGTLTRWQGYLIQPAQPTALPATGTPSSALLATNVSSCRFAYDPLVVGRNGLVTMHLAITAEGETVTLYSAAHVSNQP
jgi:MSHA biogenesis protein MshO